MSGEENQNSLHMQMQLQNQRAQMQQQQLQLHAFWQSQIQEISQIDPNTFDFKTHQLPLARIKKIMKTDEDVRVRQPACLCLFYFPAGEMLSLTLVCLFNEPEIICKMISAEAPVLFAKACEMFILELSLRAWIHTEENKRRTLQRNDIAMAITKTDVFDFLIDIVPRDDIKPAKKGPADPQMIYQQQLQQQQAAMLQQIIQQQAQTGNAAGVQWPNPQVQQQMLQQYQQRMQAMQQGGLPNLTPSGNDAAAANNGNAGASANGSSDQLNINQRSVDV